MTFSPKLPLSMMAKPVGSGCNLRCAYCYYLEKDKLYPEVAAAGSGAARHQFMGEKILETYIAQTIYTSTDEVVQFAWHGGEPIMRGMDFFNSVIRLQQRFGAGRNIANSLQTNGTTLTDEWCRFFSEHDFLIGISLDGPEHCHDHYRLHDNGRGSFQHCMRGLELLLKHNVEFNTLSVVNDYTARFPLEVYRFLKSTGSRFLQFLPAVAWIDPYARPGSLTILPPNTSLEAEVTDWTVEPADYGTFLIRIFDDWVRKDVGETFVITFDSVLANMMGVPPPVCVAAKRCGHAGVVEHNGDVYSCDHFVFPEYRLGNIREKSLLTLMQDPVQLQFGRDKAEKLPAQCRQCRFLDLCNGECPKNRILQTADGQPGLNYLCAGFKQFYTYTEPYFRFMASELNNQRAPSNVMRWAAMRPTFTSVDPVR